MKVLSGKSNFTQNFILRFEETAIREGRKWSLDFLSDSWCELAELDEFVNYLMQ